MINDIDSHDNDIIEIEPSMNSFSHVYSDNIVIKIEPSMNSFLHENSSLHEYNNDESWKTYISDHNIVE